MKTYTVTIEFAGLTGTYRSQVVERARSAKSAETKARRVIGNRDGFVVSVVEGAL
jgi:hypothetical protein